MEYIFTEEHKGSSEDYCLPLPLCFNMISVHFFTWLSSSILLCLIHPFVYSVLCLPTPADLSTHQTFYPSVLHYTSTVPSCSPFEFSGSTNDVIRKLDDDSQILIQWYRNNYLKPNPDKWHLLLSDVDNDFTAPNSSLQKILGVTFDNKLNFTTHITKLCKKGGQKIHALARISKFMSEGKRKLIMSAFISSHFSYCPLIWMCHNRSLNTKINKIHERALRILYDDTTSSFEFLLQKSKSVKIHYRNLQILVTEIYKTLNNLSPSLMSVIFIIRDTGCNPRR